MELGIAILIISTVTILFIRKLYSNKTDSLKKSLKELEATNNEMRELYSDSINYSEELLETIITLQKKLDKTIHQKKSSEVRLGRIGEQLSPFLNGWPWDSNHFRFIGSPIDGIQFTENEILFVEIKTGKSRLSKYQAKCKKLVEQGKVRFVEFRVGEDGTVVK